MRNLTIRKQWWLQNVLRRDLRANVSVRIVGDWGLVCICICPTSSVLPPKAIPSVSCVKKDQVSASEHSQLPLGHFPIHPPPNEPSAASSSATSFIPETFKTWGNYSKTETAPVKAGRYGNGKKMNLKEGGKEKKRKKKTHREFHPYSLGPMGWTKGSGTLGLIGMGSRGPWDLESIPV